jgi:hypothetical protein
MDRKLNPQENELYKRTDWAFFYILDPIGVYQVNYARDEYYPYLPQIFQMLMDNKLKYEIVKLLQRIAFVNM